MCGCGIINKEHRKVVGQLNRDAAVEKSREYEQCNRLLMLNYLITINHFHQKKFHRNQLG